MTHAPSAIAPRFFPAVLAAAMIGFGVYFDHAASFDAAPQQRADTVDGELAREAASAEVRQVAQWAVATQDHGGLPFVVVDPGQARIFIFDPQGHPTGNAPLRVRDDDVIGAVGVAGRLVADPIATARSGAIVWTNADAQLAVGTGDEDAAEPLAPALRVETSFWQGCLGPLRTQPSIAYVVPRSAAGIRGDIDRRPS